jgi:hypothetical protein
VIGDGKLYRLKIFGHEAIVLNGRVEVSVSSADDGSKILMRLSSSILDKKIVSLRINMPDKIIFVSAKDNDHLIFKAEESNNKKVMN